MKTKVALALLIVLVVVGGLGAVKVLQVKALMASAKNFAAPPESVASFVVREEKWQGTLKAIGTITAAQGVTLTPEVADLVREIHFESGAVVTNGEVLVRLDTSSEVAQLRAIEAQLELARLNLDRERSLRKENMVSQSELDAAEATVKQYEANADTTTATINKKIIRAPFSGRLGIRLVNLGQYIDIGKPIVSLQSLTPVYADFSLPQQELGRLATRMRVRLMTDTYPDRQFEGQLTAITPEVDQSTRSVSLRATFENADQLLRPGMFARVEVLLPESHDVLPVPITSVLRQPFGDSVYVIEQKEGSNGSKPHSVVRQQLIILGRTQGDFVSVESGLKAGEKIVSAGVFKLRTGMSVVENNEVTPKTSEKPTPADS